MSTDTLLPIDISDISFSSAERDFIVSHKGEAHQLSLALCLIYYHIHGIFPGSYCAIPMQLLTHISKTLDLAEDTIFCEVMTLTTRTLRRHKEAIRIFLGICKSNNQERSELLVFLTSCALRGQDATLLRESLISWHRERRLDLPAPHLQIRIANKALTQALQQEYKVIDGRISTHSKNILLSLLGDSWNEEDSSLIPWLRRDSGRANLASILEEVAKLERIEAIGLPVNLTEGIAEGRLDTLLHCASTESTWDLRRHEIHVSSTLLGVWCQHRRSVIIDSLADSIIQLVHKVKRRAKKRIDTQQEWSGNAIEGKTRMLVKLAEASTKQPDGVISEVLLDMLRKSGEMI
jgi:hypothetical protein